MTPLHWAAVHSRRIHAPLYIEYDVWSPVLICSKQLQPATLYYVDFDDAAKSRGADP